MGERLGGKLRKLPPHNGGEAEKILRSQLRRDLIFLLKIHFLKEMQLQNPNFFRLRRAVSWEQNYIDFAYCPPQALKFWGYNFPPMGETLGGKFFTSPPWGGPWGGSSKKLPPHAMGGKLDPGRYYRVGPESWFRLIPGDKEKLTFCVFDRLALFLVVLDVRK